MRLGERAFLKEPLLLGMEIKVKNDMNEKEVQKGGVICIRKISASALLNTPKPLSVLITTNCGKSLKA